jgi:lipocalin
VGTPDRKSLWILSRRPVLPPEIYQQLLQKVADKGFNVKELRLTQQRCG